MNLPKFARTLSATNIARYAALLAAMAISYTVERNLAVSHGVPVTVAPAVPVAIDLYMIWAVRSARDVLLAVSLAVAANVASVLTAESLSAVNTYVAAGLHAVFPLTVWRMHSAVRVAKVPSAEIEPQAPVQTPSRVDSWPAADLWSDFEADFATDSPADTADTGRTTPPDVATLREAMTVLAADGRTVTGQDLAAHFGVSDRTGRRYLAMAA